MVNPILSKGAEEARNQLPDLLEAAEKGRSTIITRHGRPVAALVPIEAYSAAKPGLRLRTFDWTNAPAAWLVKP